jgi:hypothetical protein
MGLSFHWVAFNIEGMLGEKMVSRSFGGAAGHGERAPGAGAAYPTIAGASKRVSWSNSEIDNAEHPDMTESMT